MSFEAMCKGYRAKRRNFEATLRSMSYSEGTICSAKRSDPPLIPAASAEDTKEAAGFKKRDERAY